MSIPQTIMGKYGWEKVTTTAQKQKVGTRMQIGERDFIYVKTAEAVTAGLLVMQQVGDTADDLDLTTSADISAGDTTMTLSTSLTLTKDQYKDGWLIFNDIGEEGHMYRIKGNTAVSSAAGAVITIEEEDGFHAAISSGASAIQCGLTANPYSAVEIYDYNGIEGAPLGWSCVDIASGSYGWICVGGPTLALITGTPDEGVALVASKNTRDGGVEVLDSDDDGEGTIVAYMGNSTGVDGEYALVMTNIR